MIVIAGGGMVGLATALHLAKFSELDVTILQGEAPLFPYSKEGAFHRVSALTLTSMQFLQTLGVWSRIEARRAAFLKSMMVFAESPRHLLQFSHQDINAEHLGCIVENDLIVHALQEEIANVNTIRSLQEAFSSAERIGSRVAVTSDKNQMYSGDLLIAADGADSSVRTFFNFTVQEKNYHAFAITAVIETDQPHHGRAVQNFYQNEILGFLPLPHANTYSLVWSLDAEQAKLVLQKNDVEFLESLTLRMQQQLGSLLSVGARHAFPLKRHYVERGYQAGVLLLGDALHRVHPLAGQGINLAFKEIMVLGDVLQHKKKRYAVGDVHLLQAFQRRAKSVHLPMYLAIDGVKNTFSVPAWIKRYCLGPGLAGINRSSLLKQYFIHQAM